MPETPDIPLPKITATLNGWYHAAVEHDKYYIIWGDIEGDIHERWKDGTRIHTSAITKTNYPPNKLQQGDIIHTLNSVYLLGPPMVIHDE